MHREKNLFVKIIAFDNLYRAFVGASHGKRDRPEVREFEYHLEPRLWEIRRRLEAGSYPWGAYRRFRITDPKNREIRAAPFGDRVVHHALFNVLDPIVRRGFIADTYACIPGRGTHLAVQRYRDFVRARAGCGYVLQCDIKSFFASVDHAVLQTLLVRRIGNARVLALVMSLITHGGERPGKGMPIGNLTSQLFANLYLDPLDHLVKETLRVRHYIRYMDDFLLLADDRDEARGRLRSIRAFLDERLCLALNPRRVAIAPLSCPRDFVGYIQHADGRSRVRRRSVRRLWRRLPVLEHRLAAGAITWDTHGAFIAGELVWAGAACRYVPALVLDLRRARRARAGKEDAGPPTGHTYWGESGIAAKRNARIVFFCLVLIPVEGPVGALLTALEGAGDSAAREHYFVLPGWRLAHGAVDVYGIFFSSPHESRRGRLGRMANGSPDCPSRATAKLLTEGATPAGRLGRPANSFPGFPRLRSRRPVGLLRTAISPISPVRATRIEPWATPRAVRAQHQPAAGAPGEQLSWLPQAQVSPPRWAAADSYFPHQPCKGDKN